MKKIAVIGAGPYGLIALDRLIKQAPQNEKIELLLLIQMDREVIFGVKIKAIRLS